MSIQIYLLYGSTWISDMLEIMTGYICIKNYTRREKPRSVSEISHRLWTIDSDSSSAKLLELSAAVSSFGANK